MRYGMVLENPPRSVFFKIFGRFLDCVHCDWLWRLTRAENPLANHLSIENLLYPQSLSLLAPLCGGEPAHLKAPFLPCQGKEGGKYIAKFSFVSVF